MFFMHCVWCSAFMTTYKGISLKRRLFLNIRLLQLLNKSADANAKSVKAQSCCIQDQVLKVLWWHLGSKTITFERNKLVIWNYNSSHIVTAEVCFWIAWIFNKKHKLKMPHNTSGLSWTGGMWNLTRCMYAMTTIFNKLSVSP